MSECHCQHHGCCRDMPDDATEAQRIEGPSREKPWRPPAAWALMKILEALDPIDSGIIQERILRSAGKYWGIDL